MRLKNEKNTNYEPLVAVLVPVYNLEKIIGFCIDSILKQTYKNIKVVIVDDGSTDNSLDILRTYKQQDERIVLVQQDNKGIGETRNILISEARKINAEYVAFIDGDDLVEPIYIEKLFHMIKETGCKISQVSSRSFSTKKFKKGFIPEGKYPHYIKNKTINSRKLLKNEFFRVNYSFAWGKMFHLSLFDDIFFPPRIYEDGFTTYKLIYKAKKIALNKSQIYISGARSDSITRSVIEKKYIFDGLDTIAEQREFYLAQKDIFLASCTYAGLLNDILFWYTKLGEYTDDEVNFSIGEIKDFLVKKLNDNIEQIIKAPNIGPYTKNIAKMCCKDMNNVIKYNRLKQIRVYIDALKNKLHKLWVITMPWRKWNCI